MSKSGKLVAVGSRTIESAQKFTDRHGGTPLGSYAEAISHPEVDAVYIGLPHDYHSEWTVKTAHQGKAILCEKPFTLTYAEAERTLAEVKKANVFFMEAFMYRCHPQLHEVEKMIKNGLIGDVLHIDAEFGFHASKDWNNFRLNNKSGGGALMDVGVYPVSYARRIFGEEPSVCHYFAHIGDGQYDEVGSGILGFPSGKSLRFGTAFHLNMRNFCLIEGTKGQIYIQDAWKAHPGSKTTLTVFGDPASVTEFDFSTSNDQLYGHEADAVAEFIDKGECPYMTPADTLANMRVLDTLRKSAGLTFSGEELR